MTKFSPLYAPAFPFHFVPYVAVIVAAILFCGSQFKTSGTVFPPLGTDLRLGEHSSV